MSTRSRVFLTALVLILALLFGVLAAIQGISSDAVSAFIGVLVGSAITGLIQYSSSEADRRNQLRLTALERRLEAHQQAYTLWRKMLFADKRSNEIYDTVIECQDWWEKNCLYLSAQTREAFLRAYQSADDHADLLKSHADAEQVKTAWQIVERAGNVILEGASLPPISELETQRVQTGKKKSAA